MLRIKNLCKFRQKICETSGIKMRQFSELTWVYILASFTDVSFHLLVQSHVTPLLSPISYTVPWGRCVPSPALSPQSLTVIWIPLSSPAVPGDPGVSHLSTSGWRTLILVLCCPRLELKGGVIFEGKNWTHFMLCQIVIEPQFQNCALKCWFLSWRRASENVDCWLFSKRFCSLFKKLREAQKS